jgi:hypothetical protein
VVQLDLGRDERPNQDDSRNGNKERVRTMNIQDIGNCARKRDKNYIEAMSTRSEREDIRVVRGRAE